MQAAAGGQAGLHFALTGADWIMTPTISLTQSACTDIQALRARSCLVSVTALQVALSPFQGQEPKPGKVEPGSHRWEVLTLRFSPDLLNQNSPWTWFRPGSHTASVLGTRRGWSRAASGFPDSDWLVSQAPPPLSGAELATYKRGEAQKRPPREWERVSPRGR